MLKRVVVRNWRAFDAAEVALRPGLNVLLGPNGAGKTSLLEAVAFALAGEPSMLPDARLLAREEDTAVDVAVAFGLDGEDWEVRRGLSAAHRRGGDLLRRGGASCAEGSAEVTEALERLLGVPRDLFLRVLYMPEGDVYRFLASPPLAAIDAHLRRVLGLEQLAVVDQAAARVKREVGHERANLTSLAEQVAEREQLLAAGRERWGGDLAGHRAALEAERQRLAGERKAVAAERQRRDDQAHRVERTLAELAALDQERAALGAAPDAADELAALRTRCAQLSASIRQLDAALGQATAERKAATEARKALAARKPSELVPDDRAQRRRWAETAEAIRQLDQAIAEVVAQRKAVAEARAALAARPPAELVADDPALREQRAQAEAAIRALDDRSAAIGAERQALAESTQFLLAHAPGAGAEPVCPVCRQPLPEDLRQRLLAENDARDQALAAELAAAGERRQALVAELAAAAAALQARLLGDSDARDAALVERLARLRQQRAGLAADIEAEAAALHQRLLAEGTAREKELAERQIALSTQRESQVAELEAAERREGALRTCQQRLDALAARRAALLPGDTTPETLPAELARLQAERAAAVEQEAALAQADDAARADLAALQGYQQLAAMEGRSPAALARARQALARRELLAELFAAATATTLERLRGGALAGAYDEVRRAWAEFSQWEEVRLALHGKGQLAVRRGARQLELAQLSGGERAAFLALLHAGLGRQFGRGELLLLDEPLEHLDATNGRRLLQHLLRACTAGALRQVVIATVEADVVRGALRPGEAHVIELPLAPLAAAR